MDSLFAVFGAALGMAVVLNARQPRRHVDVNQAVARFINLPMLILLGLALPLERWIALG